MAATAASARDVPLSDGNFDNNHLYQDLPATKGQMLRGETILCTVQQQCARLNHTCDYNPRLSFRDDTPRVLGGFRSFRRVSTAGNAVWDPETRSRESSLPRSAEDDLPPFSELRTDEDRERKAETHDPGTFHVVVNPESFSTLPEYREESASGEGTAGPSEAPETRHYRVPATFPEHSPTALRETSEDPHVVILRHFEEPLRRFASQPFSKPSVSPASPSISPSTGSPNLASLSVSQDPPRGRQWLGHEHRARQDARLRDYYKEFLSPHIIWNLEVGRDDDMFESEAARFPPLYHAMMALSSLSLAHRERVRSVDALQHYQQALPSLNATLRSHWDISSDGVLFTHFFLLLYEVAAAEQGQSNLWLIHLTRLSDIVKKRHEMFGPDRYAFIIYFVAAIDTYAVLSSCSKGEFVNMILEHDLLPTGPEQLPPLRTVHGGFFYPDEQDVFLSVLRFNQQILILSCQLGQLASEFRTEIAQGLYNDPRMMAANMQQSNRHQRVAEIREVLKRVWNDGMPHCVQAVGPHGISSLPRRVQSIFEQAYALHRACLIYSYSSMWPSQRAETSRPIESEIDHCVSAILKVAQGFVSRDRLEFRFVIFPLFMAGFASSTLEPKMLALDLLRTFEETSLAPNASSIRQLLQLVYQRQEQSLLSTGLALHVDWVEVMVENHLQVVNFNI